MSQIFKAGTQSALPGTSQGNEFGINGLHLFVSCWCFISSAAQLQAAKWGRQQLQPSCQPHQSATNGTACSVGTGTHTYTHTDYSPTLLSVSYCCHMKISTLILFFYDFFFFFYLQLFIAEKNLSSFGAFESFSKAFFLNQEQMVVNHSCFS